MRGRGVVIVIVVLLAGCGGLPGVGTDAGTASTPTGAGTQTTDAPQVPSTGDRWTVTVVEVVDGDTMDIEYANGTRETVRLLGVDAPEPYAEVSPGEFDGVPDTEEGRTWLRGWGENASTFAQRRLAGETVRIVTDERADRRGYYGRLLVYVVVDGEVFGEQLLEDGYARLYETEFQLYDRFAAAESRAQAADRGVWGFASAPS